jgi:hypothetical protein
MVRHLRRLLQRAAVLQIRRDPGRSEAVVAELGRDAGRRSATADRGVGVRVRQGRPRGRLPLVAADRVEQRPARIHGDASGMGKAATPMASRAAITAAVGPDACSGC